MELKKMSVCGTFVLGTLKKRRPHYTYIGRRSLYVDCGITMDDYEACNTVRMITRQCTYQDNVFQ
jgi:hypothetical protein